MYGIGGKFLPPALKKKAAVLIPKLLQGKIAKNGTKLIGTLVTETVEEVISEIGAGNVEKRFWGEEEQKWDVPTIAKTAKDVLPQVALLSGGIHGAGPVYGAIDKATGGGQLSSVEEQAIGEHFGKAGITLANKSPRRAKKMLEKVGQLSEDQRIQSQQPQQNQEFTGQLATLSDSLMNTQDVENDLNIAADLHNNFNEDPEVQEQLDNAILIGLSQGLESGNIDANILADIKASIPQEELTDHPLSDILGALDLPIATQEMPEQPRVVEPERAIQPEPITPANEVSRADAIVTNFEKNILKRSE